MTLHDALFAAGKAYLQGVLAATPDMTQAAKVAGIYRTHFYRIIKSYGLNTNHPVQRSVRERAKESRKTAVRRPAYIHRASGICSRHAAPQ